MDMFTMMTARSIGPGGLKCPCCTDFRTFGNHAKQIGQLSKLRRTRLKRADRKEYMEYCNGKGIEEVADLPEVRPTGETECLGLWRYQFVYED